MLYFKILPLKVQRPERGRKLPGIKEARKRVGTLSNCWDYLSGMESCGKEQSERLCFSSWSYKGCKSQKQHLWALPHLSHDRNSTTFVSFTGLFSRKSIHIKFNTIASKSSSFCFPLKNHDELAFSGRIPTQKPSSGMGSLAAVSWRQTVVAGLLTSTPSHPSLSFCAWSCLVSFWMPGLEASGHRAQNWLTERKARRHSCC